MARNGWTRWGRGDCEGYGLEVGHGNVRFHASVSRGKAQGDGEGWVWWSSIKGLCRKDHPTREEAMARVERELAIEAEQFARDSARATPSLRCAPNVHDINQVEQKSAYLRREAVQTNRASSKPPLSNVKSVGEGVLEYKIDFGPGYRVDFGRDGEQLVILLTGGTKKRQQRDIETAAMLWRDYKRTKRSARCTE